tara:strand:+ start:1656 stop:2078 length:423 start_codon:yes stop_codon:yes gene_type:complete
MATAGRKKIKLNTPEILEKITDLGSQGLTSGQIARSLGVSWDTLDRRRKEYAEIEEAIKKGEALGINKVTNALMQSATNDKNVTAQIFYLKNRDPQRWADRQEHNFNLDLRGILADARERTIEVKPSEIIEEIKDERKKK